MTVAVDDDVVAVNDDGDANVDANVLAGVDVNERVNYGDGDRGLNCYHCWKNDG